MPSLRKRAGLLIHGRGRAVEEMLDVARRIGIDGICWAAPKAPGGQWYPHRFTGPVEANEPALTAAIARCDDALKQVTGGWTIPPDDTIVVGFSQGACLASEYVRRHPDRAGMLMMFTGGLIGPEDRIWKPAGVSSLEGVRVLITGSDSDQWVTEARVRHAAATLSGLGAEVDLHIYPGRTHLVSDDEIRRARAQIVKRVGSHL